MSGYRLGRLVGNTDSVCNTNSNKYRTEREADRQQTNRQIRSRHTDDRQTAAEQPDMPQEEKQDASKTERL